MTDEPSHCDPWLLTGWLLLLLEDGACHGYELRRRIAAHRVDADRSIVYRMLRRLERDGCVESGWTESVSGPRRRLYRLTPRGRLRLEETERRIEAVRNVQEEFMRARERAGGRASPVAG